jgi:hypothetical protein
MGARVPLVHQHAARNEQCEEIDRIETREARDPEVARTELPLLCAIRVVVGENEAGEEQKEADRRVAVVDDGGEGSKPFGVGEVKKNDVECGKGAQAGQRRKPFLFRLDDGGFRGGRG